MARLFIPGNENEDQLKEYFGSDAMRQIDTLVNTQEFELVSFMRDGHVGYQSMPIGGVTASYDKLAPGGAGFDIGCGNWIGKTSIHISDITRHDLELIGHEILQNVAIGLGVDAGYFADDPLLDDIIAETKHIGLPEITIRNQFGSVGAGNHYIDLMKDTDGHIWVALHYGSRKLGHSVASHYLKLLGAKDGMFSQPVFMDAFSEMGVDYWHDMELAGAYAMMSRRKLGGKIIGQILKDTIVDWVENHHNYIWLERHYGQDVFVTRKGATPVSPGVRSFIGGSMGTDSAIVTVKTDTESMHQYQRALGSAPHGAGRVMGRAQAKGNKNRAPRVTTEMMNDWMQKADVVRVGGDVDESPHCYRNLVEDVLPYHTYLQVVELLTPVLTVMNPSTGRR